MESIYAACLRTAATLLFSGALLAMAPQSEGAADGPGTRLDEELVSFEGAVPVFVRMEDQLFSKGGDYERFCAEQPASAKRLELRAQVTATLKEKSKQSLGELRKSVVRLIEEGEVRGIQRYWIVNGFACKATAKGCAALAALPGVGFVYRQQNKTQVRQRKNTEVEENEELTKLYRGLIEEPRGDSEVAFELGETEVPWNLQAVGADQAWKLHGITGKGVIIAVLDDGMMTVPTLLPALWRNAEESLNGKDDDGNGLVDDVFGFDFANSTPYSVTPAGHRHGTLCASVIAARPFGGDKPIAAGVAPRALVMPLIGNGQLLAYEYALEQGADVLSMSYTFEPTKMGHYRGLYRLAHEHLSAAGIVSVGGAGNYALNRPAGEQIGSPKDVPCVIAAAGVGADGEISSFSSRGPVSWEGIRYYDDADNSELSPAKPDVTACNADFPMWTLRELWTGSKAKRAENAIREDEEGYVLVIGPRGNSFAGPHAAGVIALMLEACPELPVWQVQRLLESTAKDMGEPGRDLTSGAGMLQAHKAVEAALAYEFK